MTCDYPGVALRIVSSAGVVLGDLHADAAGRHFMAPLIIPDEDARRARYTSPRSNGDHTSGPPLDDPGDLIVTVDIEGGTWGEREALWQEVRGWVRAEWDYQIEYEANGVIKRWRTERPSITIPQESAEDYKPNRLTYQLRFICQPNPTITIGG